MSGDDPEPGLDQCENLQSTHVLRPGSPWIGEIEGDGGWRHLLGILHYSLVVGGISSSIEGDPVTGDAIENLVFFFTSFRPGGCLRMQIPSEKSNHRVISILYNEQFSIHVTRMLARSILDGIDIRSDENQIPSSKSPARKIPHMNCSWSTSDGRIHRPDFPPSLFLFPRILFCLGGGKLIHWLSSSFLCIKDNKKK